MRWMLLLAVGLLGVGCVGGTERPEPLDRTEVAPGFFDLGIVDVAVVPVRAERGPVVSEQLLAMIRDAARSYLIDRKLYAVPTNAFVDERAAGDPAPQPATLETDAVLFLEFEEFDTADFIHGGSFSVSGSARLEGSGGTAFTREFQNLRYRAPAAAAPATNLESLAAMAEIVAREILAPLPPKPIR